MNINTVPPQKKFRGFQFQSCIQQDIWHYLRDLESLFVWKKVNKVRNDLVVISGQQQQNYVHEYMLEIINRVYLE